MTIDLLVCGLVVATGLMIVLAFHDWSDTQIIVFRDRLFGLRDDLFLDMAKGNRRSPA
jgi:hypothetical protein